MNNSFEADPLDTRWFAVWTRSRQEKVASAMLDAVGVQHFLPLKSELRQWSDRKRVVTVPLFSGYLFVRMNRHADIRLQVLKTPGIAGFVGNSTGPLPIPDQQIEDIRIVLTRRVECAVLPHLEECERVRVIRGPLAGLEGILLRSNSTSRLLISVEVIHKSLAAYVSRADVVPAESTRSLINQSDSGFRAATPNLSRSDPRLSLVS